MQRSMQVQVASHFETLRRNLSKSLSFSLKKTSSSSSSSCNNYTILSQLFLRPLPSSYCCWLLPFFVLVGTSTASVVMVTTPSQQAPIIKNINNESGTAMNNDDDEDNASNDTTSRDNQCKKHNKSSSFRLVPSTLPLSLSCLRHLAGTYCYCTSTHWFDYWNTNSFHRTLCDNVTSNDTTKRNENKDQSISSPSTSASASSSSTTQALPHNIRAASSSSWISVLLPWKWNLLQRTTTLPLPRLLQANDPDFTLSPRKRRIRTKDETKSKQIQAQIEKLVQEFNEISTRAGTSDTLARNETNINEKKKQKIQQQIELLVQQSYEILYGPGVTPIVRKEFLERYGLTGWTEDVITELLQLGSGSNKGYIAIGVGNGQWPRILTDRYHDLIMNESDNDTIDDNDDDNVASTNANTNSNANNGKEQSVQQQLRKQKQQHQQNSNTGKKFEYVVAYDDMTHIPLNLDLYTKRTKVHRQYFYPNIQPYRNNYNGKHNTMLELNEIFQQWHCRGRILLLVYPPPGPMAFDAVQAYISQPSQYNTNTIVYIGEGRGGVNANDDFFDYFEGKYHHDNSNSTNGSNNSNHPWILEKVLPVLVCGTKGYEQLYILKRYNSSESKEKKNEKY